MSAEDATPPVESPAAAQAEAVAPEDTPAPPEGDARVAVLEALLFASVAPLTLAQIGQLMGGLGEAEVITTVATLRARYEGASSGVTIAEVGGGYQLATKLALADWVLRLHGHRKKNPITAAVMETLAIVAYKQPIARAEIEAIRGVDCGSVLRSLQDAELIEVVGRREVAGRPAIYGTSGTFLKTFGLRTLDDLPSQADFRAQATAAAAVHGQDAKAPATAAAEPAPQG